MRRRRTTEPIIKAFEAKYPNIKVNYVNVPFSDAKDKFKTAAQSQRGSGRAAGRRRLDSRLRRSWATCSRWTARRRWRTTPTTCPVRTPRTTTTARFYGVPQVTDTLTLLVTTRTC